MERVQTLKTLASHISLNSTLHQPPDPILQLPKCIIRPYSESDAEAIAKAANNPEIARWMRNTFPQPYSLEDAKHWISVAKIAPAGSPLYNYAICDNETNTFIGAIGLKPFGDIYHRTIEVGYWIGEDHWGKGIATEALNAFTSWTFEHFKHVIRIEAEVVEGNDASCRVLERAGYTFEARKSKAIEKWGVVLDATIYCTFRPGV